MRKQQHLKFKDCRTTLAKGPGLVSEGKIKHFLSAYSHSSLHHTHQPHQSF